MCESGCGFLESFIILFVFAWVLLSGAINKV